MSDVNAIPQWFSGSEHTHRVAAAIAQYGPIARTTLAQMLGLSQGALSRITSDLIYAGVIEELPAEAGPSGKLPERFTPREVRIVADARRLRWCCVRTHAPSLVSRFMGCRLWPLR